MSKWCIWRDLREKRNADIVLVEPEDNPKNWQLQLTELRSRPEPGNCVNVFSDGSCGEEQLIRGRFCFKSLYVRPSVHLHRWKDVHKNRPCKIIGRTLNLLQVFIELPLPHEQCYSLALQELCSDCRAVVRTWRSPELEHQTWRNANAPKHLCHAHNSEVTETRVSGLFLQSLSNAVSTAQVTQRWCVPDIEQVAVRRSQTTFVSPYEINFPAMNPVCSGRNKGFSVSCVLTASGFTNSSIRCLSGEVGFKFHVEVRVTLLNWITSESLQYKLLLVCKGTMIDIYDSNQIFHWLTQRGSIYKVTGEIKTDTYVSRIF